MYFPIDSISWSPYLLGIALTGILTKNQSTRKNRYNQLLELLVVAIPILVLATAHRRPEMIIYSLVTLFIYVWSTRKWQRTFTIGAILLIFAVFSVWKSDYLQGRINEALNPADFASTYGYFYIQIKETIASAGWWGHGFGSPQEQLPFIHSAMFPVYLISCFGWGGGLLLLGVVLWFISKLSKAARMVREPYGKALIVTLGIMLAVRLVYGLAVLSGSIVLVSIPFPFLSYGSHVLIEYAAVGLLLGIYRRKDIISLQNTPVTE